MKATISACLLDMVEARFGKDAATQVIKHAGLEHQATVLRMPIVDIPDEQFTALFVSTLAVTGLSAHDGYDAFGEHWCCVYAPKMYKPYLERFKSAKEMISGMDALHVCR